MPGCRQGPPYPGYNLSLIHISRRRLEIWENHVPKDRLASLVEKGASEQELAKLLKRDLSLLADAFAFPEEEYIVFAEFPTGTGRVLSLIHI